MPNDPTATAAGGNAAFVVTPLTRAEDMDRDEAGHLTDVGREQLAEWHRLVGLLPDEEADAQWA